MKRTDIHQRIFWAFSLAIAFFIPVFGRIIPLLIAILALNWLVSGNFLNLFKKGFFKTSSSRLLLFGSLYLLYLAGLLFTSNFEYAWFDLEVKMSLVIFPLILSTFPERKMNPEKLIQILYAFVAGCLTSGSLLLIHAAINQFDQHIEGSFYYTRLAWYFHATYLSVYYAFTVIILLIHLFIHSKLFDLKSVASVLLILFFSWMIILLSSKAGILALGMVFLIAFLISLHHAANRFFPFLITFIGMILVASGWFLSPESYSRFSATKKAMANQSDTVRVNPESNADRLAVWSTALEIILKNPVFGVGTGDVKDALLDGYRKNNAVPALRLRLNAHSQVLQTTVTLGIPGLVIFLWMFLVPAWFAFKKKQWIYLLFLLVFLSVSFTESMLEVQAGVIFYAFFNAFLFSGEKKRAPDPGALLNQNELVRF